MHRRLGVFGGIGATLTTWFVGDTLLHPPSPASLPAPRWLPLVLLSAMVGLIVMPTALSAHNAGHDLPRRYRAFAWFVALVRLASRLAGGFIGGLVVELILRHGSMDAGSVALAAVWHGGAVAAMLGWRAVGSRLKKPSRLRATVQTSRNLAEKKTAP